MADNLFTNVRILSPEEVALGTNPFKEETKPNPDGEGDPNLEPKASETKGIRILAPNEVVKATGVNGDDEDDEGKGKLTPKPNTGTESKGSEGVNIDFQKFAEVLAEKGLFELPEDGKIESDEDIIKLMNEKMGKGSQELFDNWKKSLPEKEQAILGFRQAGYDTDEAIQIAEYEQFVNGITEESSEEDLEETYRLYLQMKDLDDTEIKDSIESAKDLNKLKEKALFAKEKINAGIKQDKVAREAATRAEAEAAERRQAESLNRLMSVVDETEEIVPGLSLTPAMKEKVKQSMTTAVETHNGQQLNAVAAIQRKNPEGFNMLLHYYTQMGLFNVDDSGKIKPDFSKVNRKLKSKETNSLIETVTGKKPEGSTKTDNEPDLSPLLSKLAKFS